MSNWKDSKLFLAASCCFTGFAAAATLTFTYIIPVYQKQDSNTINELQTKINNINKSHKEKIDSLNNTIVLKNKNIDNLQSKNSNLIDENNSYKNQLLLLSNLSIFQHGQPLPIGYSSILPGMKLSDVSNKYSKEKLDIDSKGELITVKVETGGVDNIIYIASTDETPGIITSIVVNKYDIETLLNEKNSNEQSLLTLLQENLGHIDPCNSGEYIWQIDKYRYVYYNVEMPYFYRIFFRGIYAPGTSSKCLKLSMPLIEKGQ